MRFTRTAAAACATALVIAPLTGCGRGSGGTGGRDLVIAADLELSGAAAAIGMAYDRALSLKVDQLNAARVLGGDRKIRLAVKDNRSDANLALKNVGDFTADPDVTALITGACSRCLVTAARTINERRVPAVALAPATGVGSPIAERRFIFKLAPNAEDTAAMLTAELRRNNVRSVALLLTDDPYGADGRAAMTAALGKVGIALTDTRRVKVTDTDVSQPVAALTEPAPDALVVWTFAEQAGLAAASARAGGYRGRLFFDAAAAGDLFLAGPVADPATDTVMTFTQTMVIDDVIATTPTKAARKQWFRDYTARHGSYFGYASFAADAVQLIVDAAVKAGGDRERIRDILETTQLDGLSGPIRLTPDNHSGLMPQALTLLVARGGRWRLAV